MKRRWHRWTCGPLSVKWYWGTHGNYGYGWHWKRGAICAGQLYIVRPLWRRPKKRMT